MTRSDADSDAVNATAAEEPTDGSRAAASREAADAEGANGVDDDGAEGYAVPPGATAVECPRCGRPFARERHRDLHVGLDHRDLDAEERAAYEAASEAEHADLRRFRIVSLGLLVLLYFGFLFLFAIAG